MGTYYKAGSWNALCQVCGFQYKSDELRKRWDSVMCCSTCWESRHPMDFMRVRGEEQNVPWTSPQPDDVFVGPVCAFPQRHAMADRGTADCALADSFSPAALN